MFILTLGDVFALGALALVIILLIASPIISALSWGLDHFGNSKNDDKHDGNTVEKKREPEEKTDYKSLKKALMLWLKIGIALLLIGGIFVGITYLQTK